MGVEYAQGYILFYAVLFFTSISGLIGLLDKLEKHPYLLLPLYLALMIVLIFSIMRYLALNNEIMEFQNSGKLGEGIQKSIKPWNSLWSFTREVWFAHLISIPAYIYFGLLYLTKSRVGHHILTSVYKKLRKPSFIKISYLI